MNLTTVLDAVVVNSGRALPHLADAAVKGLVVLALAAAVARLLRSQPAAARHLIWLMALAALLALPLVSTVVPVWRLAVLPASAEVTSDVRGVPPMPAVSYAMPAGPELGVPAPPSVRPLAAAPAVPAVPADEPPVVHAAGPPSPSAPPAAVSIPVPAAVWVFGVWLVGALVVAGRLAVGLAVIARRRRQAEPLESRPWPSLAAELARSLGLARRVRLLIGGRSTMPMAVGVFRPAILLPREALAWPAEKHRVVLLHELAHVRRLDCLTQPLAHLALALHWFNPLAWLALRRLTAEREQACDDAVLAAGAVPSSYAGHLLDVARTLRAGVLASPAAVTMARCSQLEARLREILDTARPRRAATRRMLVAAVVVAAAVLVPVASLKLARAQPQAQPQSKPQAEADARYKPIPPESRPTSDVAGVVRDESGRPVGGVDVLAVQGWERDGPRRTAQTDAGGRFAFPGLAPPGYWFFSVDDPRYGWEWDHERGRQVPAGPERNADITLFHPRTLRGTVADEAGKPVAGVRVVLVNQLLPGADTPVSGHIDIDFLVAETDDAGRFTMERLRPGRADFVLEHDDFATTFANVRIEKREETTALTIERGLTLRGRVVHDGKPLAGVAVGVGMNEAHRPVVRWEGETDADGRFEAPRIRSLPARVRPRTASVSVWVRDEKWQSAGYGVYQISDRELAAVTIEARPAGAEKPAPGGHVDVGKPSKQAPAAGMGAVTVSVPGADASEDNAQLMLVSLGDDYGSYHQSAKGGTTAFQGVPPGKYTVSLFGGQARPRAPKTVEVVAGQTAAVALEPGPSRLEGVVRSGGKPVGGGHVSWFASPGIPRAVYQGGVVVQPDGRFVIEGLTEDSYRLVHETLSPLSGSLPHEVAVKVAGDRTAVDINLPTGRIEGKLVGRTPKPTGIEGVGSIRVFSDGFPPQPRAVSCTAEAGADGRFTVEHMPPGRYTVSGYGLATEVTIDRDGTVVSTELKPPERTGEIEGTVRGLPAGSSTVYISAFPKRGDGYALKAWVHQAQADAKTGAYRIRDLPAGIYGVFVSSAPGDPVPVTWVPDIEVREGLSRELNVQVPRGRLVSVETRDLRSLDRHRPVSNGWRLRMPTGDWLDESMFVGAALPFGEYTVDASYGPRGVVRQTFTVTPGEGMQTITLNVPKPQAQ